MSYGDTFIAFGKKKYFINIHYATRHIEGEKYKYYKMREKYKYYKIYDITGREG